MTDFETITSYALSKQVPCIEQEAVFQTNYGELRLTESESRIVSTLVKQLLESRLFQYPNFFNLQQDIFTESRCFSAFVCNMKNPIRYGDFRVTSNNWRDSFLSHIGFICFNSELSEVNEAWIALCDEVDGLLDKNDPYHCYIVIREIEEPV